MNDQKDSIDKVKEMSRLAVLSNKISDVQLLNLKNYPFIAFDGIKEAKLEYDLSYEKADKDEPVTHNPLVSYRLVLDESRNQEALGLRLEAIEKWVRNLFWKDVLVKIYFNDKIVFESKKNEK